MKLGFLGLILLALLLGACSQRQTPTPPGADPLGEADVVRIIRSLLDDVNSVSDPDLLEAGIAISQLPLGRPGCPTFPGLELPAGDWSGPSLAPQSFIPPEGTVLTRGTFHYDPYTGTCSAAQDSEQLILHYVYRADLTPDGFASDLLQARLTVDWGDTLDVAAPSGALVEVPTTASFSLDTEGRTVGDLTLALTWFNSPTCGSADGIFELSALQLDGRIGLLELDAIGFTLSDDRFRFSGALESAAGIRAETTLEVRGDLTRSPCFSTFAAERGRFSFGLDSSVTPESHSLVLEVDLSEPVFAEFPFPDLGDKPWDDMPWDDMPWDSDGAMFGMMPKMVQGLTSLTLQNGVLRLNDAVAARFSGVLDDENNDGVSGENVRVVFADGTETTLQTFLTDNDFGGEPLPPFGR